MMDFALVISYAEGYISNIQHADEGTIDTHDANDAKKTETIKMALVHKNIWLSGWDEAHDKKWLEEKKITHILNCAGELECEFPKQYIYKHLPLLPKANFDILPYLDSAADFILKSIEEGVLLIHGYRGVNRSAACLFPFWMKFLGWDYGRCMHKILKNRNMTRFSPYVEKS